MTSQTGRLNRVTFNKSLSLTPKTTARNFLFFALVTSLGKRQHVKQGELYFSVNVAPDFPQAVDETDRRGAVNCVQTDITMLAGVRIFKLSHCFKKDCLKKVQRVVSEASCTL